MKTLKDHVILYDAVCPMCRLYTKGFVQSGMLDQSGRLPYQNMPDNVACLVDKNRMVNEIALVHKPSGKVYYGVESLLRIIGHSYPKLKFLFGCSLFIKIAGKFYKFVSFNRRVIAPSKKDEATAGQMDPGFDKTYRFAYLVFTWLVTAFLLYRYSLHLSAILPPSNVYREFLVCGGQIIWQGVAVGFIRKNARWDYLGNMMTISFAGAILLLFGMMTGRLVGLHNPAVYMGWFFAVVALMFFEHMRRAKLLELSWIISFSWLLYRIIILLIILFPSYVK